MIEQELIENGYELVVTLGSYKYYQRGATGLDSVVYPDGQVREAKLSSHHSGPHEMLRDLAIKRVLQIVSTLPGIQAYPLVLQELTSISDSLVIEGDIV